MKKIDMSESAVHRRLRQIDELHALSVALLRAGRDHYQKLVNESKASEKELVRYRRYLV